MPAVLDLVEMPCEDVALIVMEEWSPQLITDTPCCMQAFLVSFSARLTENAPD